MILQVRSQISTISFTREHVRRTDVGSTPDLRAQKLWALTSRPGDSDGLKSVVNSGAALADTGDFRGALPLLPVTGAQ